ncbi:hypothetical protein M0R72_21845, partial [Candidatus Pacearchaeota archaeon]|nr:hypothetical protein [Candidatus Pacearchaeota archaeon]
YDYYWNESSASVTQDLTATPLAATDILSITYTGYFKLIAKATQTAEVTRQRLAQGFGTGKIEKTIKDISLKSQATALEAAQAKLAAYASVGRKLEYDTLVSGLAVGTMQTITLAALGLTASSMLIYSMRVSWPDGITTYSIQTCEGPVEQSWQNIFCGIVQEMKKQSSEQAGEADVVQGLEEFAHLWISSEHPNPFLVVYPDGATTPASIDFPCLSHEDRSSYCILYDAYDQEFFRKQVTLQSDSSGADEMDTTCLILSSEGNGTITSVALWGGTECSDTPGSGIEMTKYSYTKVKNALESLQLDFSDIDGT